MIRLFHNIFEKMRNENMNKVMDVNAEDNACYVALKHMQDSKNEHENICESKSAEEKMYVVKSITEMPKEYQNEEFGEFVSYYCAIKDPVAEIVIMEYFPQFSKVEKLKKVFKDDFSVNRFGKEVNA